MSERTLWLHWGRTGAGPRFLLEMAAADHEARGGGTYLSHNPDAEIAADLDRLVRSGVPTLPVPTYLNARGVITGLPRLARNAVALRRWIRREGIGRVVTPMWNVYQSFAVPLAIPRGVEFVPCVHDAAAHPGEANPVQWLGARLERARADRLVTFSTEVAAQLAEVTDTPISVVDHPPFDSEPARTAARDLPGRPVFGIFGRMQHYKGIDLALAALRILRDRGIECEVRIVGDGPDAALRDTADGTLAQWDVRWIPEGDVAGIVDAFDVMLLPYREASQSGPAMQAMSHALPAVATPVGALPGQVAGFGVIADDATPEAIADAMADAISSPGRYRVLSATAVEAFRSAASWSDAVAAARGDHAADGDGRNPRTVQLPGRPARGGGIARVKWARQRVVAAVNRRVPVPSPAVARKLFPRVSALATGMDGRRSPLVVLPATHGSMGDEGMMIATAQLLAGRAAITAPGDVDVLRNRLAGTGADVIGLGGLVLGRETVPSPALAGLLADRDVVVIGADTIAGDYELMFLATRVRMLNYAAAGGRTAILANFSLPRRTAHEAAALLRSLNPRVHLVARDTDSQRRAAGLLGRDVDVSPDLAGHILPDPNVAADPAPDVVLVPNNHMSHLFGIDRTDLLRFWADIGAGVAADGRRVDLLPHDVRDHVGDVPLSRDIRAALAERGVGSRLLLVDDARAAKAHLAAASSCITGRMHAAVAALSSGVPTVGLEYVGKFTGQFRWHGDLGTVVEHAPNLTAAEVLAAWQSLRDAAAAPRGGGPYARPPQWLTLLDDAAGA